MQREPQRLEKLHRNGQYFLELAKTAGFDTGSSAHTPIVPIILGDSITCIKIARALQEEGYNAAPILSPAVPNDKARIRFLITHDHTEEQLFTVMEKLIMLTKKISPGSLKCNQ